MSAVAEQPPHTLPPPGANFCCFRLEKALKPPENVLGTSQQLFSPWLPLVPSSSPRAGMSQSRQRGLLPDLLKHQHISYAGLTPSLLVPEMFLFSPAVLPGTLEGSISARGFPLLTLPSVEVRSRHTLKEPLLGLSLFPLDYELLKSYDFLYPYKCKVSLHPL